MILRVWHDYENEVFSLIPIFDKLAQQIQEKI